MELAVEEVFREEPTEEEDAPSAIEKPKKPHGNKGRAPTAAQIANLEKGREVRKAMKDERIKEEVKKRPNVAKALKVELAVPSQPDTPPPKPKLKRHKQVIVFQSDSESDEEANQIIIKRSKRKPTPKKAPEPEQEEYYEPEPQFFEPEPRFRLKRV
jgi:hypothetical protein